MKLTSHERIMRIFRGQEIDRPALKLWGAGVHGTYPLLNPAYEPVSRLAGEITDLFGGCSFPFHPFCGRYVDKYREMWTEKTDKPLWEKLHTVYHTPKGDLHSVFMQSTIGEPGYIHEYLLKEPEDIEALLSMDYAPYPIDRSLYDNTVREIQA